MWCQKTYVYDRIRHMDVTFALNSIYFCETVISTRKDNSLEFWFGVMAHKLCFLWLLNAIKVNAVVPHNSSSKIDRQCFKKICLPLKSFTKKGKWTHLWILTYEHLGSLWPHVAHAPITCTSNNANHHRIRSTCTTFQTNFYFPFEICELYCKRVFMVSLRDNWFVFLY